MLVHASEEIERQDDRLKRFGLKIVEINVMMSVEEY